MRHGATGGTPMAHVVGKERDTVGVTVVADVPSIVLHASYGATLEVSCDLRR